MARREKKNDDGGDGDSSLDADHDDQDHAEQEDIQQ